MAKDVMLDKGIATSFINLKNHCILLIPFRSFMKWGMDIVGKLPKAHGEKVSMLVMIDDFSKGIATEEFV